MYVQRYKQLKFRVVSKFVYLFIHSALLSSRGDSSIAAGFGPVWNQFKSFMLVFALAGQLQLLKLLCKVMRIYNNLHIKLFSMAGQWFSDSAAGTPTNNKIASKTQTNNGRIKISQNRIKKRLMCQGFKLGVSALDGRVIICDI